MIEAVLVRLPGAVLDIVYPRAQRRAGVLRPVGASGPSHEQWLRRQVRGVAAEEVVVHLLREALGREAVEDLGDCAEMSSDIRVTTSAGVFGIEVKATTYEWWLEYGRAVTKEQLSTTDAVAYVWCAAGDTDDLRSLHVIGWSSTDDVRASAIDVVFAGAPRRTYVKGHVMADPVYDQNFTWVAPVDGPGYGLDDTSFDSYEWAQAVGGPDDFEAPTDYDETYLDSVVSYEPEPDPLALLERHGWVPGGAPWPKDGPDNRKEIVGVKASIRPFSDLIEVLRNGEAR